ncbi:MAG TPA: hypothetical protein VLG44_01355 [Chlamydiales bacterium]|nr:hypothetical protein [Chlamydiales bacterium]
MMRSFLFSILLVSFSLFGEELQVRLKAEKELPPIYLTTPTSVNCPFSDLYMKEIEEILYFDLDHTGLSSLVNQDVEKEIRLKNPDKKIAFDVNYWGKESPIAVIKPIFTSETLTLQILDNKRKVVLEYSSPELSQDLTVDRNKVHLLLSKVQKELFGLEGIFHKKIIFSKKSKNNSNKGPEWISEIWMCDFDGQNPQQLTFENNYSISPRFIDPVKKTFAYVSYKLGQAKIYSSEKADESWISLRGNQALFSFSQTGDRIAFICDANGRPDLFIQAISSRGEPVGKPKQIFSFPKATQASPTFSPDGRKIAFVSDKDGPPRIYMMDITKFKKNEPGVPELVSKKNRQNSSPSWSPDGTKIAYSAKTENVRQVWIYDLQTKEEWQLTTGNMSMENPSFASDSIHLTFNSEDGGISELYLSDINTRETVKISEGIGQKRFPSWE